MRSQWLARAAGICAGIVADRLIRDPRDHHPVAYFGRYASWVEKFTYRDTKQAGVLHLSLSLAPIVALGYFAEKNSRRPLIYALITAASVWACCGANSLVREGEKMAELCEDGDIDQARAHLSSLCGRDPDHLDVKQLSRATIESLAENTADAAVASLFWTAIGGIPALLIHRSVNTLDAMIGHRNARYRHFGSCAAVFDDLLDWIPARLTALCFIALSDDVGSDPKDVARIVIEDHAHHPSPNGGWCESAMAGALGIRLGGRNIYYGGRVEDRGILGNGPLPDPSHIHPAATLVKGATWLSALGVSCGLIAMGFLKRQSS